MQLYVAGHDVAALRETLASELAKINDPGIESHPAHVAWQSLDDAVANDILGQDEVSEEARFKPGRVSYILTSASILLVDVY